MLIKLYIRKRGVICMQYKAKTKCNGQHKQRPDRGKLKVNKIVFELKTYDY